jgi:hypothetical protein
MAKDKSGNKFSSGKTPLDFARAQDPNRVEKLLKAGADPNLTDAERQDAKRKSPKP